MATPTELKKRRIALQRKHDELDINEPFTPMQQRGLGKRNMAFVRNLQISRKISKDAALKLYGDMNLKNKKQRQKRYRDERKKVEEYYSQSKPFVIDKMGNYSAPKTDKEKKIEKKQVLKLKSWIKNEKKKLRNFFGSEMYKGKPKYNAIKQAHKIYPDATLYELRHGVNSRASSKFRMKHGLSGEYSGRVKT